MKSMDTVIFTADLAASVLVKVSLSDTKLMGGEYFNKSAALGRFYIALIIMVMSWLSVFFNLVIVSRSSAKLSTRINTRMTVSYQFDNTRVMDLL